MALTPQAFYADLVACRASAPYPFAGWPFDQMAWAIAYTMVSWAPQVRLVGSSVGSAGSGAINVPTTRVTVAPAPPLVISGLASAGLQGPLGVALGTVVGQAIPKTITAFGQYTGAVQGVGTGADVSAVVAAPGSALSGILQPLLGAFLGAGPASSQMAAGLGTGIASLVRTGAGVGSVVGSASPAPASGVSISVLV